MKFQFIFGVDVSKEWLNFCLKNKNLEILSEWRIDNTVEAILKFLNEFLANHSLEDFQDLILVMEHTGIYVQHLVNCCLSQGIRLSLVHATKISEHLGGKTKFEEKDDALDARRIAEYGIRFNDKLELWQANPTVLIQLKRLQAQRNRVMKAIHQLEVPLQESKLYDTKETYQMQVDLQADPMEMLKQAKKNIEKKIDQLIKGDEVLKGLFKLLISVKGVGKVIAREVILTTKGFKDFTPIQGKAYARYSGVAPGPKQSGKKKGKNKTPKRGNRKVKSLLTMGAISLIGTDSDLGRYYDRKIKEGKEHLMVINAMRNKLILRIFAVVRNQTTYQKNLNISLD